MIEAVVILCALLVGAVLTVIAVARQRDREHRHRIAEVTKLAQAAVKSNKEIDRLTLERDALRRANAQLQQMTDKAVAHCRDFLKEWHSEGGDFAKKREE